MNKDIQYTDINEKQKNEQDKYDSKQLNQENEPKSSDLKKGFKSFNQSQINIVFILLFFLKIQIHLMQILQQWKTKIKDSSFLMKMIYSKLIS